MIEINLIPDVKQELLRAQRTRATVISVSIITSIIAGSIVVVLALYVFGAQTLRSALLDKSIKDNYAKLEETKDLSKILTIQNQLTKISELNSQKNIDSRVFDMLSAFVPTGENAATLSQITIDAETGSIRLEGQTAGYSTMEVFKKTLQNAVLEYSDDTTEEGKTAEVPLATDISTSDVSYGVNSEDQKVLRFVLTFTYAEQLFSTKVTSLAYKLSVNGNVTDSYLGIPRTIFETKVKDAE